MYTMKSQHEKHNSKYGKHIWGKKVDKKRYQQV